MRAAVVQAFEAPIALPPEVAGHDDRLAAHGRLGPHALRAALSRAFADVVRPCADALLAGGSR